MAVGNADWQPLERVEFESLGDVWDWCSLGAGRATNTGLIIMHAHHDFFAAMRDLSSDPRTANRRARRVANHVAKIANHLAACKNEFQRIPATLMKVYEPEITAARQKYRKRIDLSAS